MRIITTLLLGLIMMSQQEKPCSGEIHKERIKINHCQPYQVTVKGKKYKVQPPCFIEMCICMDTQENWDCTPPPDSTLIVD